MKLIEICGTNGTGKTTLVKGLLASGRFMKMKCIVDGAAKEWWFDGETAVIGKYGRNNCCGVDAGNYSGEQIYKHLEAILDVYAPKAVVLEDVRYGTLYTFKQRMREIAERHGGSFCVLALYVPLEMAVERVIGRTGNEKINIDAIMSKQAQVLRSTRKIQADGVMSYYLDTSKFSPERLLLYLKRIVFG